MVTPCLRTRSIGNDGFQLAIRSKFTTGSGRTGHAERGTISEEHDNLPERVAQPRLPIQHPPPGIPRLHNGTCTTSGGVIVSAGCFAATITRVLVTR